MYVVEFTLTVVIDGELIRYPDQFVGKDKESCIRRIDDLAARYARILKCPVGVDIKKEYTIKPSSTNSPDV